MNKKCCRFFAGMMGAQSRWLNKMADNGYRLVRTDKLLYEFEPCEPGKYEYCVEYIGGMTSRKAEEYKEFLEDLGYCVFYKNINLNYSAGKVYLRPWAEKGGLVGTGNTTLNKELLIIGKKKDGHPFELHTTYEDRIRYTKSVRNPWLCMTAMFLLFFLLRRTIVFGILTALFLIPTVLFQAEIVRLAKASKTKEW